LQSKLERDFHYQKCETEKGVDVLRKVLNKSRSECDTVQSLNARIDTAEAEVATLRKEIEQLNARVHAAEEENGRLNKALVDEKRETVASVERVTRVAKDVEAKDACLF
jgi:predicted  nucleic acid-binding Zn-ribbon protein